MEMNDIMTCIDRLPQGCSDKRYAGILKELPDECQSRIRKTFTQIITTGIMYNQ